MLEEPVLEADEHDGDRDDQEILAVEIDGAELDAGRVEPALQHLRLRAVEGEDRVREEDRGADRRDDHRQEAAVAQRVIDAEVEQRSDERHAAKRHEEGKPIGPAEIDREHHHHEGGDHRELALREIHHVRGAEDQHEAERHQGVDGPDADAGEEKLESEVHCAATGPARLNR